MTTHADLEAAAKAATLSEWKREDSTILAANGQVIVYDVEALIANLRFIALANPARVLALLSEIRGLEQQKDEARALYEREQYARAMGCPGCGDEGGTPKHDPDDDDDAWETTDCPDGYNRAIADTGDYEWVCGCDLVPCDYEGCVHGRRLAERQELKSRAESAEADLAQAKRIAVAEHLDRESAEAEVSRLRKVEAAAREAIQRFEIDYYQEAGQPETEACKMAPTRLAEAVCAAIGMADSLFSPTGAALAGPRQEGAVCGTCGGRGIVTNPRPKRGQFHQERCPACSAPTR